MEIKIKDDKALVFTPYNGEFVTAIKKVGGAKWNREVAAWSVPAASVPAVREIMRTCYGEDDLPSSGKKVDLRVTISNELSTYHGDVTLFGKCLSHAYGRDSGAKVGPGVSYIKGGPESGGSVKNWRSEVASDSVVILSGVPETLISREELPDGVSYEVIAPDNKSKEGQKMALEKEMNAIMERLAEIDRLLAELEER